MSGHRLEAAAAIVLAQIRRCPEVIGWFSLRSLHCGHFLGVYLVMIRIAFVPLKCDFSVNTVS